ncbi:MAG: FAD-linked oxidase C-terminal domain-containing protein [Bacteroidota bacterium]
MISNKKNTTLLLHQLAQSLSGELYYDQLLRVLYATDASVYRELPLAVAIPKNKTDIQKLIAFAQERQTSLIPRAAGTSLAGQCVGNGIVVDISKHFTKILEVNEAEAWVRVQSGVVRDELNTFLKPLGFFFSPITSTANRAMIGGMVGNNSCGTTSIEYGSTRDHLLELKTILADGSEVVFGDLSKEEFEEKCKLETLEGQLYRQIQAVLKDKSIRQNILDEFPKASIHRRNTGYAVDYLMNTAPFVETDMPFNFCKLLCGSEGTLAFTTEIKLHIDRLPLPHNVVVAAHFTSINDSMRATQIAMQHQPSACELMDKVILDCTKENIEQSKNRFFVEGDPAAILTVEFRGNAVIEAEQKAKQFIAALKYENLGYAFPIVPEEKSKAVWQLRSAGLGLLANIPGDKKAVACIEDTAVDLEDLPNYIEEFSSMMEDFGQQSVYYAHAGAGELHLRPILDLKKSEDREQFYQISEASARLVKKYQGSLSGEHGDGRVRAAFIPLMVGEANYELFRQIKNTWDANNIFNPGKIVDAPPMNTSLRYEPEQKEVKINTILDFSELGGILRAAEKCNGSGDCRKLPLSGGTMCPSYQATRNEKETTRARANTLREFLTRSEQENPFDHKEIKEVMDLCLSCKGCTSECPSNVDMAGLKAEFLHQYYQDNGVPLRARAFANINRLNQLGSIAPSVYNFFLSNAFFANLSKKVLGVAKDRSLPTIQKQSLKRWFERSFQPKTNADEAIKTVYLFCDEFTNWNDTEIGKKAVLLLDALGYEVKIVRHPESGRAAMSKGLLKKAKGFANANTQIFRELVSEETPLIGIEPSAILSFRDEYPRLVDMKLKSEAKAIAKHTFLIEEFLYQEIQAGNIQSHQFIKNHKKILLHGHCHQKALSDVKASLWLLSFPENFSAELIPSGCCGMAGSFGYEEEHYDVSMQVGELVLFPAVRAASEETIVVASGTSCRHQILDGVARQARHSVEVLWEALRK